MGRLGRRQFENLSTSSCLVLTSPKAGHQSRTWKRQFIWKVIPGSKSDSEKEGKTMHRCGVAWATAIASGGRLVLYLLTSKVLGQVTLASALVKCQNGSLKENSKRVLLLIYG